MKVIADSTVLFHLNYQQEKMLQVFGEKNVTVLFITRINYIEILSGTSENAKASARKFLRQFEILEFDKTAAEKASNLAMKYRVSSKNSKDFLIASIAIANKIPLLTENNKDFNYKELKLMPYRIS